jgi:recombination protein RecT
MSNVPAERAASPIEAIKKMIAMPSVQEQFRNALADNAPLFIASLIDVFGSDKTLQKCSPKSVIMEALKAATLKLPINKGLGFAYVVPYGGSAQFQIGYRGFIQLAMRTGQYRYLNADVVYAGELQKIDKLTGEIDLSGNPQSLEIIGYFAHMETINGFRKTIFWSKEQVLAHAKKYSKAFKNGPWQDNFDAMAIKTVIRSLLGKYGILSVEMTTALSSDREEVDHERQLSNEAAEEANQDVIDFKPEVDSQGQEEKKEEVKTVDGGQDMPDWM